MSTHAPDPDKRADRRVAVILGLLSLLAVPVGVLLGGYVTNEAQNETLASQSKQASRQYIRDQRRQAYAELLRANRQLLNFEQDLLLGKPVPEPRATQLRGQATVARRSYFGTVDLVKVVGPKALLSRIFDTLTRAHNAAAREITRQNGNPRQTAAENRRSEAAMHRAWEATDQIVLDFLSVLDAEK